MPLAARGGGPQRGLGGPLPPARTHTERRQGGPLEGKALLGGFL